MKCLLIFLNLSLFVSNVASLVITVQPQTIAGSPTLVAWSREDSDAISQDLVFDLRFVQGLADVGLAQANIVPSEPGSDAGTAMVVFPSAGKYLLKAVSGSPRNTVIGSSTPIEAVQLAPSSSAVPSSALTTDSASTPTASISTTSSAPSSTSSTSHPTSTISATLGSIKRSPNLPAIVGGVIGGLLMLALLAFIFVFINRRRKALKKRLTFHKDMMVQRRVPPPSMLPNLSFQTLSEAASDTAQPAHGGDSTATLNLPPPVHTRDHDVEQGLGSSGGTAGDSTFPLTPGRPLGTGHIVPSPKGPRPSIKRTEHTIITARPPQDPLPLRTKRQKDISDRIAMLREQMLEVQNHQRDVGNANREEGSRSPDSARVRVLDDMQREMVWLRDQEHSPWAMGLTDVLPPGHARYMTP